MRGDIFTVIILCAAIVSYALGKVPLVITALSSMLVLYFTGIITFSDAFSGFANNAVIMLIGMQMIGAALSETGVVDKLSDSLMRLFSKKKNFSEKHYLLIVGVLAAVLSTVINPTLIVLMFMEITDGLSVYPGSRITRKGAYLPICISATYGSLFTSISSTTLVVTSSLIAESSIGRPLAFQEPMIVGIPCMLVYLLVFATFGQELERRCFDFPDIPAELETSDKMEKPQISRRKQRRTLLVLAVCIGFFIFSDFSLGAVSLAGSVVLVVTGCISAEKAVHGVKWQTVLLVACCLGFAKGVDVSGAGLLIANSVIRLFGSQITGSPVFLCVLALVIGSLLSNAMNNSSAAAVLVPIFITIAEQTGVSPLPVAMATGAGAMLATSTPICAPVFSIATSAGYRFKDYVRVGGLLNVLSILACTLSLYIVYL